MLAGFYSRAAAKAVLPLYERCRRRNTFRYFQEFEASQWLPESSVMDLQWRRLQGLLRHAVDTVPYYRQAFSKIELQPDQINTPADFARLPILDKATIRCRRDELVSSAFARDHLVRSATGGSTGEPLQFFYDRNSYERRVAAAMRGDGWAGWQLCGGEFYIWGVPLLPQNHLKRLKTRVHHRLLRREVVNSFELSPAGIERMVASYNRMRPPVVIGYANALYEFARLCREMDYRLTAPAGVISSAERLYDYQRDLIEAVFGAPVFDRYGCREVMMIGAECGEHNGLHVTADNLYVEIVRDGRLCEPGEPGEVLLTDLHNYGMPLIRYRVGDLASWKGEACRCGRGLPLLNVVNGRVLDVIRTPSGRLVPGEFFPHLIKDFPAVRRYQVVQESEDLVAVRMSLESALPSEQFDTLRQLITRQLGEAMQVQWELGTDVVIPRTSKFRPVISRLPQSEPALPSLDA